MSLLQLFLLLVMSGIVSSLGQIDCAKANVYCMQFFDDQTSGNHYGVIVEEISEREWNVVVYFDNSEPTCYVKMGSIEINCKAQTFKTPPGITIIINSKNANTMDLKIKTKADTDTIYEAAEFFYNFGVIFDYKNIQKMNIAKYDLEELFNRRKYCENDLSRADYLTSNPPPASRVEHACEFLCPLHTSVFLNKNFLNYPTMRKTTKEWRKPDKSTYKAINGEAAYCETLCREDFMVKTQFGYDGQAYQVEEVQGTGPDINYSCRKGNGAIKYDGKFYDKLRCINNEWKVDTTKVKQALPDYKFTVGCEGAFTLAKDNCDKSDDQDDGCQKLVITNDKTITCPAGYLLLFKGKLYQKLDYKKGELFDGTKLAGKAEITNKPQCISACSPKYVTSDVSSQPDRTYMEDAVYTYDKITNTLEIKCDMPVFILGVTTLSLGEYDQPLECSAKEWKVKGGNRIMPNGSPPSTIKYHCFNACKDSKVKNACGTTPECEAYTYFDQQLSCPTDHTMFLEGTNQIDVDVKCTSKGWIKNGDTSAIPSFDMKEANRNKILKIECYSKCSQRFRTLSAEKPSDSGLSLTCPGTKAISYKTSASFTTILSDITCDPSSGWKDASNNLILNFNAHKYEIEAKCEETCSSTLIKNVCGTRNNCKMPDMNPTTKQITCSDPSTVLMHDNKYYDKIECTRNGFKISDGTIIKSRTSPVMMIDVACISRCDEIFVNDKCQGSNCMEKKYNGIIYELSCKSQSHLTKLSFETTTLYAVDKFTCDPNSGWKSSENGPLSATFEQIQKSPTGKVEIDCHNACNGRINDNCLHSNEFCVPHKESAVNSVPTVSCPETHAIEITKFKPLVQESLKCSKHGYTLKDGQTKVFDFKSKPENVDEKFTINCVDYCFFDYVKKDTTGAVELAPKMDDKNTKEIHCEPRQLLEIEGKRMFESVKCVSNKGYIDVTNTIIDFTQKVEFSAVCVDVCASSLVTDICNTQKQCDMINYRPGTKISHKTNYRLIFERKEIKEDSLECTAKGWMAGSNYALDFNSAHDIRTAVTIENLHKCDAYFIKKLCGPADSLCSRVLIKGINAYGCSHHSEILQIKYGSVTKEAFDKLLCTDDGWKNEKNELIVPIGGAKDTDYHVEIKCVQACHPLHLKPITCFAQSDECLIQQKRQYELNEALTCDTIDATNDIQHDTVLSVNNRQLYADVTCSKEGWRDMNTKQIIIPFVADTPRHNIDAKCVKSDCIRPMTAGACTTNQDCGRPDFKTEKYSAKCSGSAQIVVKNIKYNELNCRDGNWYAPSEISNVVLSKTDPFDMKCLAGKCAKCAALPDSQVIPCDPTDANCQSPTFKPGQADHCSFYSCPSGSAFKINGNHFFYIKGDVRVNADDSCQYAAGKGNAEIIATRIECVKYISCTMHVRLDVTTEVMDSLRKNELQVDGLNNKQKAQCPDPSHSFYYYDARNDFYTKLTSLECSKEGAWKAVFDDPNNVKEILANEKIVCSPKDPNVPTPAPTTTTTTEPPPDANRPCDYCPDLPTLECDGCMTEKGVITKKTLNKQCVATSSTGRITFNAEGTETTDPLTCEMDNAGNFEWKTKDGQTVHSMSAREEKIVDKVNIGSMVAIILVPLIIIIAVGIALAVVYYRRKQEKKAKEALTVKGLEQKDDVIIGSISVEDPKTLLI